MEYIKEINFAYVLEKNGEKLVRFCYSQNIEVLLLENKTIEVVNNCCFDKNDIKIIGAHSFENDTIVQKVKFTKVDTVEECAFQNASKLEIAEFFGETDDVEEKTPKQNLTLQARSFKNCDKLHTVIIKDYDAVTVEAETFSGCCDLRTVVFENCKTVSLRENSFGGIKSFAIVADNEDIKTFAREQGIKCL